MLSRLNVKCTSDNECNIPRICPFENRIIKIEINDQSDKLYDEMNEACLNVCSELAGFGSFATLVAIAATFTAIPTDVFGISNSPIGVELGALAPGISSIMTISFIQTGVYSFITKSPGSNGSTIYSLSLICSRRRFRGGVLKLCHF